MLRLAINSEGNLGVLVELLSILVTSLSMLMSESRPQALSTSTLFQVVTAPPSLSICVGQIDRPHFVSLDSELIFLLMVVATVLT